MRRLLAITALLAVGVAAGCGSDEADQPATTEAAPSNAVVAPASAPTPGSLEESRSDHTATILDDGRVLVVGGFSDSFEAMASVEVFDPKTGAWTAAESLREARSQHGAAKLHDGRVLVMGGLDENLKPLGSAEVYDPATGTWTPAPALAAKRYGHTVTMLSDGSVLVVAGQGSTGNVRASESLQDDVNLSGGLSSAELYDASATSVQIVGSMLEPHHSHTATLLQDGSVLVVGGLSKAARTAKPEVFDPETRAWTAGRPTFRNTFQQTLTTLPDGRVVQVGGFGGGFSSVEMTEIFDPATETWMPGSLMNVPHMSHTATLLSDGRLLVTGGVSESRLTAKTDLYDPATNVWTPGADLHVARATHTATLLDDGSVLVVGGRTATVEIYNPTTGAWTSSQ